MKTSLALICGLSLLLVTSCGGGTDATTTPNPNPNPTPVADTGGPKVSGYSMGGGGTVSAGQTALIATFNLTADTARLTGAPKLTFKGISGSTLTLMTASCALADARHLACTYPVTAADVGKASGGLRFDAETSLSGGGTVGVDGKTAPLSQTFGGGTLTIGGTKF